MNTKSTSIWKPIAMLVFGALLTHAFAALLVMVASPTIAYPGITYPQSLAFQGYGPGHWIIALFGYFVGCAVTYAFTCLVFLPRQERLQLLAIVASNRPSETKHR